MWKNGFAIGSSLASPRLVCPSDRRGVKMNENAINEKFSMEFMDGFFAKIIIIIIGATVWVCITYTFMYGNMVCGFRSIFCSQKLWARIKMFMSYHILAHTCIVFIIESFQATFSSDSQFEAYFRGWASFRMHRRANCFFLDWNSYDSESMVNIS